MMCYTKGLKKSWNALPHPIFKLVIAGYGLACCLQNWVSHTYCSGDSPGSENNLPPAPEHLKGWYLLLVSLQEMDGM